MRKVLIAAVTLVLMSYIAAFSAQNGSTSDPRLDQKVTYEGGYKRLYAVVQELSQSTGTTISCGANGTDWQVRDIPIFVNVPDLPLGKLLSVLADITHTEFTSKQVGENISYRIYRTQKKQNEISAPVDARMAAGIELADWTWDALVAYGNAPDSVTLPGPNAQHQKMSPEEMKLIGKIFASLGEAGKAKVLACEPLRLRTADSPQSPLLRELYDCIWNEKTSERTSSDLASPSYEPSTEADIQNSYLLVQVNQAPEGSTTFMLSMTGFSSPGTTVVVTFGKSEPVLQPMPIMQPSNWQTFPEEHTKQLENVKELHLRKRPQDDWAFQSVNLLAITGYKRLRTNEDWNLPALQVKVEIAPADKGGELTYSDVLMQVAKSSGLNIISEDFKTERRPQFGDSVITPEKATVADILRKFRDIIWYYNEDNNLLLGQPYSWRMDHANLLPESVLTKLRSKMNKGGIQLDDYVELTRYSSSQLSSWIDASHDLSHLSPNFGSTGLPLWKLYDSLSASQKKQTISEEGLHLGSLDLRAISDLLEGEFKKSEKRGFNISFEGCQIAEQAEDVFGDPEALADAVLRVKKDETLVAHLTVFSVGSNDKPEPLKASEPSPNKPRYMIELVGSKGGKDFRITDSLIPGFPIEPKKKHEPATDGAAIYPNQSSGK